LVLCENPLFEQNPSLPCKIGVPAQMIGIQFIDNNVD
jgi:hypothetical protein